jgi:hypothetical protein
LTGKVRQVKAPVTRAIILAHLRGLQPYGVYLLIKDRIHAMAIDFDESNPQVALEFMAAAKHYEIPTYIERSKAKGHHVWTFFNEPVLASKARLVARHILEKIEQFHTEVFPKQDSLNGNTSYGNFINAPLFGALVPQGRTVFIGENGSLKPYPDQWEFLENIQQASKILLDEIIEINKLEFPVALDPKKPPESPNLAPPLQTLGLLPCAQRILNEGVKSDQRVTCFHLAVQLRKTGLPSDIAIGALKTWARKNKPENIKRIITEREIAEQTAGAYEKNYSGCGCDEPAIARYCDAACLIHRLKRTSQNGGKR